MIKWRGLTFMLLFLMYLSLLLLFVKAYSYHGEVIRLNKDMVAIEDKMRIKTFNWTTYLEQRVNRLAQSQDEYQYSTSERIDILEQRLKQSEILIRNNNKNVNINNVNVR